MQVFTNIEDLLNHLKEAFSEAADDGKITVEQSDALDSDEALTLAKLSATDAQNDIMLTAKLSPVELGNERYSMGLEFMDVIIEAKQRQVNVWLDVYDRLQIAEERARLDERGKAWESEHLAKDKSDAQDLADEPHLTAEADKAQERSDAEQAAEASYAHQNFADQGDGR